MSAVVGWVSVGPRGDYERLAHSRVLAPVDDKPVWSIVCFVVGRQARGQGVATALLDAAIDYARDHGATTLEAYPIELDRRRARRLRTSVQGHALDVRAGRISRSSRGAGRPRRPRHDRSSAARSAGAGPRDDARPTGSYVIRRGRSRSSVRIDTGSPRHRRLPDGAQIARPRLALWRRPPNENDAPLPTHHRAYRRRGSREICAHLELAAGGRTANRRDHEPWARSGPRLF